MTAIATPATISADVIPLVLSSDDTLLQHAPHDANAFVSYVLRDEETGGYVHQAPMHEAWHEALDQNRRVVLWSHTEAGKTQQISVGRVLLEIGRRRSLRVVIVSNTQGQSKKIVGAISRYIESSAELHRVFPDLVPDEPWTDQQLFVRRPHVSKDPSIQAIGVHGNITGARIDLLILDDILDYENCKTQAQRQDLWDWIQATLIGRLTRDSRVWVVGNAYHPEDTLHRFARQSGWRAMRYPVVDPVTGAPRWPEKWPLERIEERRGELSPIEFARQMLCMARDDSEARFKREYIDVALARGNGKSVTHGLVGIPMGFRTYTGVDLGVQRHAKSDLSVLFTIAVHPDESREVLNIESGRWTGPEIVNRIIDTNRRYGSIVMVENNAAQDYILQFARGTSAVTVLPFTTGRNKAHPEFGVESLAAEMAGGKWIIPNIEGVTAPEVNAWITEMLYYDPGGHTGDRLMAAWFAREATRVRARTAEVGRLDLTSR